MQFGNVYEDSRRAEAYSKLEFPGTYYLAFRDLPEIIAEHVKGNKALDFGCGTGRSTRFLRKLGFTASGIDISEQMIKKAREIDLSGDYHLVKDDNFGQVWNMTFDLVLSAFTFDNIPAVQRKIALFKALGHVSKRNGIIVNLVSSPDIYKHEWASFSTKDFPENRKAVSGDIVRIVMKDVDDQRPVEDILWEDDAYRQVYESAGLKLLKTYKPLAKSGEPYAWINETMVAPWVIYVIKKQPQKF